MPTSLDSLLSSIATYVDRPMRTARHFFLGTLLLAGLSFAACDFLDIEPRGSLSPQVVANKAGVEALLIGAYGALDGQQIEGLPWEASPDNWIYGAVAGGDAHKGSNSGDQPAINPIATFEVNASNGFLNSKWKAGYEGVARANAVLATLSDVEDATEEEKNRIAAEARFLRGHYYFDLKKMFNMVPWIDETTEDYKVPNDQDIWPNIEADFQFAMDNLPETQAEVGRANMWAAASYLAKTYVYQEKWSEAKTLFDQIIDQGQTSNGLAYDLVPAYQNNFRALTENNSESVFAIQMVAEDGTGTITSSNQGAMLNFPYNSPFRCCGFFQPTQDLVNSYQTQDGLPVVDDYNATMVTSDAGVPSTQQFDLYEGTLDPRLDWSVGRRGVPYLDWGPHPGQRWIRDPAYAGPYAPKKNIYWQATQDQFYNGNSWAPGTAINYPVIRFADVLLMAAEAEANLGNLEEARAYVNRVRARAANEESMVTNDYNEAFAVAVVDSEAAMNAAGAVVGDWVVRTDRNSTFVLINDDPVTWQEYEAPNYEVAEYTESWSSQEEALDRIYFERKLELAMEGHRFFDLVRWGEAEEKLNDFFSYEGALFPDVSNGNFQAPKNNYYPIPQRQIDLSTVDGEPTLQQNPGY